VLSVVWYTTLREEHHKIVRQGGGVRGKKELWTSASYIAAAASL